MKLTKDFLWSKVQRLLDYWEKNGENNNIGRVYRSHQICITENGNYNFIIYNLRGFFDGHFLFTVNPDTFEYAIRMFSSYGGLTWTNPPTENKIYTKKDLSEETQIKVEAYIAYTLCLCFYSGYKVSNIIDIETQKLISKKQWYTDLLTNLT